MSVTIASRFCGPPGTGNGGYVCGVVANHIAGPAEVTLRAPAPLDTPLAVSRDGDKVIVTAGDAVIAEARAADPAIDPPPPVSFADAGRAAARHNPDNVNFFPGCFVCGAGRAQGDGLRIFPGKHNDSDIVAAPWIPTPDLANADGLVAPEFLWAALDCPSYFAQPLAGKKVALLGRFTAAIRARPKPGEKLTIAAWPMGADGRKHFGGSTIFRADGAPLATARSVWIELK
jgi:hypothetical protein